MTGDASIQQAGKVKRDGLGILSLGRVRELLGPEMKRVIEGLELLGELLEVVPLGRREFLFKHVAVPHGHGGVSDAVPIRDR